MLTGFVRDRCAEYVHGVPGAGFLTGLLTEFVPGGKYVRSTFTYLGWLSGSGDGRTWAKNSTPRCALRPAPSCCTPSPCCRTT